MNENEASNRDSKTLSKFKKQIDNILEQLNDLNQDDKTTAFNYVKKQFLGLKTKEVSGAITKKDKLYKRRKKNVNAYFRCNICGVVKSRKLLFLRHMEEHIETPISCRECKMTFNNRISFNWHLTHLCRSTHKVLNKKYKCSQCPKEFLLQTYLFLHQSSHKKNKCRHCGLVLVNSISLKKHLLKKHNDKLETTKFKCDRCTKVFVKRRSLFHHLQQHYKFVCLYCGCFSNTSVEHDAHTKIHEEKKPWLCNRCGDRFSRRQLYFNHLKRHDQYKCLTCEESFAAQAGALKHRKSGHVVQGLEPRLHCPYCPLTFFRSLLLQTHLYTHKDEKSTLQCKFCNESFQTQRQYFKHCLTALHEKQDTDIDVFVCEYCGKQFVKKLIFERHLHRFHGQKLGPYTCSHCEYKTKFRPNLFRHLKLHFTKENQFMCDHCGKYFSNEAVLNDHINYIHKEVKRLKCDACDKSFKRKSELTRHLPTHSDLRPYSCEICSNTYKRVSHLRRHEEHAHGVSKKSNRVKRFVTDDSGKVVPVPLEPKTEKQSGTNPADKLYLNVLNKIPVDFNRSQTKLHYIKVGEQCVTSLIPVQPEVVEYKLIPSSNVGNKVFSVVVSANDTSHDIS